MNNLAKLLKRRRIELGLKTRDIAEAIGVDPSLQSRFEAGKRLPNKEQIYALSAILKVDEKEMMVAWLSSRIIEEMGYEPYFQEALKVAEAQIVKYETLYKKNRNPELQDLLDEIDIIKKELVSLRELNSYKVAEALEMEYTYNSNKIEGNTLTLMETELVINKGMTISGKSMREHLEAINHSEALSFLKEIVKDKKSISERLILQIHSLVLRGIDRENAGVYRKVQVRIGGSSHTPPDVWQVPIQMESMLEWYRENMQLHPVLLAAEMHERLVSIHPFIDGNGRISRLLMNLILLQHGYVIANIQGDMDERLKYYESLDAARNENREVFLKFIAEIELRSIRNYLR